MATATQILMTGEALVTSGNTILECIETYLVEGLTGSSSVSQCWQAINATGLPLLWTDHPIIWVCAAVQYMPELLGDGKAKVRVRFVNHAPQIVFRGGCGLESVPTDMDYLGRPMLVSNYNAGLGITSPSTGLIIQPPGTSGVVALKPRAVFNVQRVVPDVNFPTGVNPIELQKAYTGAINSDAVEIKGVTFDPGTLLCENVGFDGDGLFGVAWRLSIEVRYNPEGHNPEGVFVDSETGRPGLNLTKDANFDNPVPLSRVCVDPAATNAGRKVFQLYDAVPMAQLFGSSVPQPLRLRGTSLRTQFN